MKLLASRQWHGASSRQENCSGSCGGAQRDVLWGKVALEQSIAPLLRWARCRNSFCEQISTRAGKKDTQSLLPEQTFFPYYSKKIISSSYSFPL